MSYHGKVRPGSPGVHELTNLLVTKASVGPMDNNAYLLTCRDTGDSVLIDAATEPDVLLEIIGERGVRSIITTHRHEDHWAGLADIVRATGAETIAGADDVAGIPVPTDRSVGDGDTVRLG